MDLVKIIQQLSTEFPIHAVVIGGTTIATIKWRETVTGFSVDDLSVDVGTPSNIDEGESID